MHRLLGITAILMFASALGFYAIFEYAGWPLVPLPWWVMPAMALIAVGLAADIAYEYWREKERAARRARKVRVVSIVCFALFFALASPIVSAAETRCDDLPTEERWQCVADYNAAVEKLFKVLKEETEKTRRLRQRIEEEGIKALNPELAEKMRDSGFADK